MSRHTSRNSRWTPLGPKEYQADFGVVRYRAGAWEGTVRYQRWQEMPPEWADEEAYAGRFKRPRNAMIAVEDKAREILRRGGELVKVLINDKK